MSYARFSIPQIEREFQVKVAAQMGLFAAVPARPIGDLLARTLEENVPLALAVSTEKVRSELIVAPVLVELRRQMNRQISLFSGVEFEVDPARGLAGFCDFLISRSPQQLAIEAPVLMLVEAKKDDIKSGLPQCVAEMIAGRIFNEREQTPIATLYGAVTTGNRWVFLKLAGATAYVDLQEYDIANPEQILGILLSMVGNENSEGL